MPTIETLEAERKLLQERLKEIDTEIKNKTAAPDFGALADALQQYLDRVPTVRVGNYGLRVVFKVSDISYSKPLSINCGSPYDFYPPGERSGSTRVRVNNHAELIT